MNKKATEPFDDDFGFSFVSDEELSSSETNSSNLEIIEDLNIRLESMYNSIYPLLENLKKNPDKSTIYWPDRVDKIDAFQRKLDNYLSGHNSTEEG